MSGSEFFIDGSLLAEDAAGWRNLGDWSATDNYRDAAEALATRVGAAAGLRAGMSVLDLACGYGASMQLWQRSFGITAVAGLELQSSCVDALQQCSSDWVITQGRFDQLPLPAILRGKTFDAVVCVDAAYHARSLEALLEVASSALLGGGRLAFTTLAINPTQGALPAALSMMLRHAGIPPASLRTPAEITAALASVGYHDVAIEILDQAVLRGFVQHVGRREQTLDWRQRFSPGWLKIKATGMLCSALARSGRLHYVLVSASSTASG